MPQCLRRVFFASQWRFLFSKHYVINPSGWDFGRESTVVQNPHSEEPARPKTHSIEIQRLIQFYNSSEAQQSVEELKKIRFHILLKLRNKPLLVNSWKRTADRKT